MKRLLVLDDEPSYGVFIRRVAESQGWSVETATDPAGFQEHLRAAAADVVILDLQLGGSDGVAQLPVLKGLAFRGTILLMSGNDDDTLAAAQATGRSLGLAMGPTLGKPIRLATLRATLDGLTGEPSDGAG